MTEFFDLFLAKRSELLQLFVDHMNMTTMAVLISLAIGAPLGILVTKYKRLAGAVIGVANVMQSIPSVALLALAVPIVGIGKNAAILMVFIYALLPIIKNTYTGVSGIDPKVLESAKGIGLSPWQILFKIQLPIAVPYIMAGIRISAVAAVGTMTIAAFAGAGGLGWFINLGLNSGNPPLVLLGAIPASMLALFIDFILSKLERVMTSEGLKAPETIRTAPVGRRRREKYIVVSLCLLLAAGPMVGFAVQKYQETNQKKFIIGTSNFTEAVILGYIYSELVESNTDIRVEQRFNLNGAVFSYNALANAQIDQVVSYTGSILSNYLHRPLSTDPEEVYQAVRQLMKAEHGIHISNPLGFNNTYVMSVTPETAKQYGLRTLSDAIHNAHRLNLGCTVEFVQRDDCLPLLEKQWQIKFKTTKGMDSNIRYQAIANNEVDIIDAFSTDALLEKLKLVPLIDDIKFFPPYYAVALTREDTLERYPELKPLFAKLEGRISNDAMRKMNYKVDIEGMDAKVVAHEFLLAQGLIGPSR